MKLKKWRNELKKLIQYELFHEHTLEEIIKDPFIYTILFFFLSGIYVALSILMYIISLFV